MLYSIIIKKFKIIYLRIKELNMEQEKEYNDFIALGRKCYPKQDNRYLLTFIRRKKTFLIVMG